MSHLPREKVAKALLHTLKAAGVKWIRYILVDISNSVRCIALNIATREVEEDPGIIFHGIQSSINAHFFVNYADEFGYDSNSGTYENMFPNVETLHILPYNPTHAAVYCTCFSTPDTVSEFSTRAFLENQISSARSAGIHFAIGVEIEFFLLKDGKPISTKNWANDTDLNDVSSFIDQVVDMLSVQTNACSSIEVAHVESGHGQYELIVKYSWNPMEIADSIITIRQTIHAVAKQHGYRATFLPKPMPDIIASGMHLHLSFSDMDHGANKLPGNNEHGLSETGSSMIMGVVKHLPALIAITQPSRNSYLRMKPGNWIGSRQNWEVEGKDAAIRVCRDFSSRMCTNIELRLCDGTANPYLAIGAFLAAALDGITNRLVLCPPHQGDELPNSLADSLDALKQSQLFKDVMGPRLFDSFMSIKEMESQYPIRDVDVY